MVVYNQRQVKKVLDKDHDLFINENDEAITERYSPSNFIHHRTFVSNKVVVEQSAKMPERVRTVSLSEAYYHLYKWHFCALTIDYHKEVGNNLHQIVYRMLKYRCQRDQELLPIIRSQVPAAFYTINGGGKIKTRVQGGIGLRADASVKEIWAIMRMLVDLSTNP